jgi:hypothetical protein
MREATDNRPGCIRVKGRGEQLPIQSLTTLAAPLRVQFLSDTGPCWGASYDEPFDNAGPGKLRDKSD